MVVWGWGAVEVCLGWRWMCGVSGVGVFFCKQETAYEMLRGLVGSEMCIRDSHRL